MNITQITDAVVGAKSSEDGETTWHARAELPGNYHTVCGLSLDDDMQEAVRAPRGQKVDCTACHETWLTIRKIRAGIFGPLSKSARSDY